MPLRFFFCRFLSECAAGLFLGSLPLPALSIWIGFTAAKAIFFEELSEQEVGLRLGITQSVVNKRKAKILAKLRKIMENKI